MKIILELIHKIIYTFDLVTNPSKTLSTITIKEFEMEIIFWLGVWFIMIFVIKYIWENVLQLNRYFDKTNESNNETKSNVCYNILLKPDENNLKIIKDYINSFNLNYIERTIYESITKKKTLFHLIINESQYNLLLKFINDNNLSDVKVNIVEKLTNIENN